MKPIKVLYTINLPDSTIVELTLEEAQELYNSLKKVLPDKLVHPAIPSFLPPKNTDK